eukprot:scaffold248361_cov42-Cyclotella_meneghiniana.AAC.1
MVLYGVALLPLAEQLRRDVPEVTTPQFADDLAAVGNLSDCAMALEFLIEEGPKYGYFPEPEKTHIICTAEQEPEAKSAFLSRDMIVNYSRGERYLGGFVGSKLEREKWVKKKVEGWERAVIILAGIAKRFPQAAFAGMAMSLQHEWQFVARTVPDIGHLFEPIERAIRKFFLPNLLGVDSIDANMRELLSFGVKQAGLGIRNPVESAEALYDTSKNACEKLVEAIVSGRELCLAEHKQRVRMAGEFARNMRQMDEESVLERRGNDLGLREKWRLKRAASAGIWLSVPPNRFNGTVLSSEEFRDNLRLRYNLKPLGMPETCDGCGKQMTVEHALSCKVGGLVHIRHDDVAQEWGYLCGLGFKPSRVSYEPLINTSRGGATDGAPAPNESTNPGNRNRGNATNGNGGDEEEVPTAEDERADPTHSPYVAENENRGDVAVEGFWKIGRQSIFDIRLTDTECRTTRNQDPEKVLNKCEKLKKAKHLAPCLERRRDFTPLVYSVDGMAGRETKQAERKLASRLAHKWNKEYSYMVAYVRARMALAVVRSNSLLVRGSRKRRAQRPLIDEGAAMLGWQTWRERY